MKSVIVKTGKEEHTIQTLNKSLGKRITLRKRHISLLESKKDILREYLEKYYIERTVYVDLYSIIHTIPKREVVYNRIILKFLMENKIKLSQLSLDCEKWEPWSFDIDQLENKIDDLIFLVPVKKQLRMQMDLQDKNGSVFIQREIFKLDNRIDKIKQEMKNITYEIQDKIKIENAFIETNFQYLFMGLYKQFKNINNNIWSFVYRHRIITPKMIVNCIKMMKTFNQYRFQNLLYTLINSPHIVVYLSNDGVSEPVGYSFIRRMIKTHSVMKNIQIVVEYLYTKKPNSVRHIQYKQFTREMTLFNLHYKSFWIKTYIKEIPFIRKNAMFSDILINTIYEYIY